MNYQQSDWRICLWCHWHHCYQHASVVERLGAVQSAFPGARKEDASQRPHSCPCCCLVRPSLFQCLRLGCLCLSGRPCPEHPCLFQWERWGECPHHAQRLDAHQRPQSHQWLAGNSSPLVGQKSVKQIAASSSTFSNFRPGYCKLWFKSTVEPVQFIGSTSGTSKHEMRSRRCSKFGLSCRPSDSGWGRTVQKQSESKSKQCLWTHKLNLWTVILKQTLSHPIKLSLQEPGPMTWELMLLVHWIGSWGDTWKSFSAGHGLVAVSTQSLWEHCEGAACSVCYDTVNPITNNKFMYELKLSDI